MKFYQYEKCESCRKAKKWLDERWVSFSSIAIRENPPSKNELKEMLVSHDGNLKKLFNTSSKDYREPEIKEQMPSLSEQDAFAMLTARGNLVKRPFLIGDGLRLQGFKPDQWEEAFNALSE